MRVSSVVVERRLARPRRALALRFRLGLDGAYSLRCLHVALLDQLAHLRLERVERSAIEPVEVNAVLGDNDGGGVGIQRTPPCLVVVPALRRELDAARHLRCVAIQSLSQQQQTPSDLLLSLLPFRCQATPPTPVIGPTSARRARPYTSCLRV